jgi:DNA polymerase
MARISGDVDRHGGLSEARRKAKPMTSAPTAPGADRALESLLAFWSEAGVDACYEDQPVDRAVPVVPPPRPAAVSPMRAAPPAETPANADLAAAIAQARAMAAEAKDLASLEAAIAAFDGCPLKFQGAKRAVFSRGSHHAAVAIVGEGPGADEDAQGAPFVGRAGKLLDRMLEAAGLQDRVFITNTVFWRPPGNRTPTADEQAACAPFVERALDLLQPKILLLVGGASAKSMLRKEEGILSLRGRWFEWRAKDSELVLPALPTLHPAFLLRQPAAKKKAWSDLLTLVERLDRPDRPD